MLSNHTELTDLSIQLNPLLTPIQSLPDSSENSAAEEVEEKQIPAIQNLYEELEAPDNDAIKDSCETAIASYLKCLPEEKIEETQAVGDIKKLQQHVMETLQTHLSQSKKISVIKDCSKPCTCCYIIPPYLMQKAYQVDQLRENLLVDKVSTGELKRDHSKIRNLTERVSRHALRRESAITTRHREAPITLYDAENKEELPGKFLASDSSEKRVKRRLDHAAKQVLKTAINVREFWLKNFNLNSFDGKGAEIRSTVHFGHEFTNAVWDPDEQQMLFGDGNGVVRKLTNPTIVAHEFGHAVTGNKLYYEGESGALNEHFSDVWGALVEQYRKNQPAHQANWLIGDGSLRVGSKRFALRSMKAPGTAYDSPLLGKDPQPDHYSQLYRGDEDNGGVHYNSGIPNKAFYLFAISQGGYAWEKAGQLWFLTLQSDGLIHPNCTMHEFARATIYTALKHFPDDYKMHRDLTHAWRAVGLA